MEYLNIPIRNIIIYTNFMKKNRFTKEYKKLAQKLKDVRKKARIEQVELAARLGKHQSYISKIETGHRHIDIFELKELCQILKKDINYFIN